MSKTALIAGQGGLPKVLADALMQAGEEWAGYHLEGFAPEGIGQTRGFRIEHLGSFLTSLRDDGMTRAVFGGSLARPPIDPTRIDAATMPLVPRMAQAIASGDDAALRVVIDLFEEAGLHVVGTADIAPHLTQMDDIGAPSVQDQKDIARALDVHGAMGALDIGQGVVVAKGQVLAVEALPGTDWMLDSLTPPPTDQPDFARPGGGVFLKAPKPTQDRRIDLPTIGPETVRRVAAAGLNGLALERGGVLVLDHETVADLARDAGLWLHSYAP